jgi:NADPH:quinone reductase-like Zn-dependent oxidoreductase
MPDIRKAVIASYGDPSHINVITAPVAPLTDHEVQVRAIYAGFSGADVEMRLGRYPMQRAAPLTPGYCMVGRVETLGSKSHKFKPGDIVAALTIYDSQAELVNVPEKYLVPVPDELSSNDQGLQQVATLGLDWNTAYGLVERAAKVRSGQRVFVHGASGACGNATATLCLLKGAKVFGTASERNHAELRELGITPFVYTDKNWMIEMKKLGGAHAVFDPLGFESYDESYSILSDDGGVLVAYGMNKPALDGGKLQSIYPAIAKLLAQNLKVWSGKRTTFYSISRDRQTFLPDFETLMEMCKKGAIHPPIKHIYDLTTEGIREAHSNWGKSGVIGSVIIRVEGSAL